MLPNPYVLLAALLAFLAVAFGGYRYGYSRAEDAVAARVATVQNEAIAAANVESKAATKLAVGQIAREADARVRAAGIRRRGEIDATAKARPDCVRDQQSMELLQSAIDSANHQSATSDILSAHMP